jgi:hypothetical protein
VTSGQNVRVANIAPTAVRVLIGQQILYNRADIRVILIKAKHPQTIEEFTQQFCVALFKQEANIFH